MTFLVIFALFVLYLLFVALVGIHCVEYFLWAVTGQDITWLADLVLAAFFSAFFVPASVLLWVAGLLGIVYPLI
jgi:hypothetical protein